MRILLAILLTISPILGHAQLRTNNKVQAFNRAEGAAVFENYSLGQGFDKSTYGATASGSSTASVTTGSLVLYGRGSLNWASSTAGETVKIRTKVFPLGLNSQNCQSTFTYAWNDGASVTGQDYKVYVLNSSATKITADMNLPATTNVATQKGKTATVFYPCPSNDYVDLTFEKLQSLGNAIQIDEVMQTYAFDIGGGVPNNVFSAFISDTGVVSQENTDWINGNCVITSTSIYTCTLVSGLVTQPMNCTTVVYNTALSATQAIIDNTTSTTVVTRTINSQTNTAAARNHMVICTKSGSDFVQPTITPNQFDFINTFTATVSSTGVVAGENQDWINGNCSVASSVFTCNFVSNKFAAAPVCVATANTNNGIAVAIQTITSSALTLNPYTSSTGAVNAQNMLVTCTRTSDYRTQANTPILIGSVTSNYSGALRESFASTATTCTTGTCALDASSGDMVLTFSSTGVYLATVTPAMAGVMSCVATSTQFSTTQSGAATSSTVSYNTRSSAGTNSNAGLSVRCIGPR